MTIRVILTKHSVGVGAGQASGELARVFLLASCPLSKESGMYMGIYD